MTKPVLGISAYYHDSAAVITENGKVLAAAQEERFTRVKQDSGFPQNAVKFVLSSTGYSLSDIALVSFYEKPLLKFERLLETYHALAPSGLVSFLSAMPLWIKEKLFMKQNLRDRLSAFGKVPQIVFPEHHLSHAASAFFPSPFSKAAVLTVDGVGEWATTTISRASENSIEMLRELPFPHSLGLLYSAFTFYTGFRVNSGEYKLMGLAPYGDPDDAQTETFKKNILSELVDVRPDGSLLLNMDYFDYAGGLSMCRVKRWEKLFKIPPRQSESELNQGYMNMALAIQQVTEDVILLLAKEAKKLTGMENLVMAGGVALNCVASGKLLKSGIFKDIFVQPAAGDAGGALGAALAAEYIYHGISREICEPDSMQGAYLGPDFSDSEIRKFLNAGKIPYEYFSDFQNLCEKTCSYLDHGSVVGWFQGKMEYGPRALGNRSILGDPRNPEMQKKLNLKIKYREGFRPFAPSVLEEDISEYFEIDRPSPYMLLTAPVCEKRRRKLPENYHQMPLYDKLYYLRSDIQAVTHLDFSARIQSVSRKTNPRYHELISCFKKLTGYGLLVNTSFNVRGEPIVCTPSDAYACFMRTEMDYLVLGDFLLDKKQQPEFKETSDWRKLFKPD